MGRDPVDHVSDEEERDDGGQEKRRENEEDDALRDRRERPPALQERVDHVGERHVAHHQHGREKHDDGRRDQPLPRDALHCRG